ncbi:PilZ domain-containing protein [Hyphococcus lacteus]|uniref:PilZ domain-containing protein n=1 Tax=Hyphococcus lacteus TaxID=3143536 RepID=A0ABV3Z2Y4_9PROT
MDTFQDNHTMFKNDARRYRRISLSLPVRIVINAVDEYEGRLLNMSPGDMAIVVDAKVVVGDAAVITIEGLDVIECTVARVFPDGFAGSFLLSKRRRALLTEQLMMLANPTFSDGLGDRRNTPRHREGNSRTVCRLDDGASLFVKIVDTSVNGVSIDAPRRPPVGASIHVGRRRGVIVRHTPRGFVVVYETPSTDAASADADPTQILRAV